jgi:hypothetical protein
MIMSGLRFQRGLDQFCSALPDNPTMVDVNPGRGEYTDAVLGQRPQAKIISVRRSPDEIHVPYRSVHGVWISDRFVAMTSKQALSELNLFWEWLIPGGNIYFCVLEGEGYKLLRKGGTGQSGLTTLQTYYQPHELEELAAKAGFIVKDAWRAAVSDRPFIHVMAQRPE